MASSGGNPNLFNLSTPNPSTGPPPFSQPPAYSAPPPSFPSPPPHTAYSYPPATPPFHHHPFLRYPHDPLHHPAISHPTPSPHLPSPSPAANTNPGARLMALLNPPTQLESAVSMPPPFSVPSELSPPANAAILHQTPTALTVTQTVPTSVSSSKLPRGRLVEDRHRTVFDIDSRLPGESQPPQLEVTPITKYISDPGLVLGRQIAVNRTYICYGLKLGAIRVLNINTALRALLKGHSQRVTDMTFFAEDVHLLASASIDGRVFVWKIDEGPDEEEKPQISEKIIIAIQIVGDGQSFHPRVCWHSHMQEILFVAIGNYVLKIDTIKLGRGKDFSAEEPVKCPVEKPIDGVQLVGKHDAEVTDLSISQWMITRLVSGSKDGMVKIWADRKAVPLATLRPHDGQPVNTVAFITSPNRPEHINLITAGPLNRELKIWTSAGEEGWLSATDSESWQCSQILDLKSSSEPHDEEAFFNQIVVLPKANLVVIANAKKNAIYAVHIDYGLFPACTRMDYIADFTVAMPILSLTGTSDSLLEGEQLVQLYCVQTQAIQQYALDLTQCLPPPSSNVLAKDALPFPSDSLSSEGLSVSASSLGPFTSDPLGVSSSPQLYPIISNHGASATPYPINLVAPVVTSTSQTNTAKLQDKTSVPQPAEKDTDAQHVSSSVSVNPDLAGRASKNISDKGSKQGVTISDHIVDQFVSDHSIDMRIDSVVKSPPDVPSINNKLQKDDSKSGKDDPSIAPNPLLIFKPSGNMTHLITPSEILSGIIGSSEISHANLDPVIEDARTRDMIADTKMESEKIEAMAIGEDRRGQEDFDSQKLLQASFIENRQMSSQDLETELEVDNENSCMIATFNGDVSAETTGKQPAILEELDYNKDRSEKEYAVNATSHYYSADKGMKQKKQYQESGLSSQSSSPFASTDSLNEGIGSSVPTADASIPQILAVQEMLNQVMIMQKEMQKQMSSMVAAPVVKEGKRVEAALGRCMEKAIKANTDALLIRFQGENAKRERIGKDQTQHIINVIMNAVNKDLPAILDRILKKEISAVGPTIARAITPIISSAITESFQRGVGDKAVNQLDKSVSSKLESTVARQVQMQFQTSGKQMLQDALRSSIESSVVPAFEQFCKTMFEQIDCVFQKGMSEHTVASRQQFEAAHTPLALTLRDAINSASSMTQNFTTELIDGQRKLLALIAAENTNSAHPITLQQSNGSIPGLPEMALSVQQIEAPMDPKTELSRLISEHKYEEAFTLALQRSDVSIVSWLCMQVDLHAICCTVPPPLSQGVLLALLQQLACDISNETLRKISWITDVAVQINPADPTITSYVRPIFEQVYSILAHQRSLPTTAASDLPNLRLVMHVINSVLLSCK
ncbi:enhancer of mRNA-decapping protein 4-like [Zingiber officinale]|uniref:enhancer of mRNA-decapping protein 4-like n=1 Tax=Zingiber officinale TaxID=94328 RepID=UPI001C4B7200|nr:enhancer of mRNA-decapping protein 4-like [Zingiber officinale]